MSMEGAPPPLVSAAAADGIRLGQLFKWASQHRCYAPTVVSTNYWVLASILLLYLGFTGQLQVPVGAVKVGAITGIVFISSMLLMTRLLRTFRVASVLTAFRLAIVVPVGLGVLLWNEPLGDLQLLGLGLALVAVLLMSAARWAPDQCFALACHRATAIGFQYPRDEHVLSALGALRRLGRCVFTSAHGHRLYRWDYWGDLCFMGGTAAHSAFRFAVGAGIGVYNLLALMAVLTALKHVPGTVFFPLVGCGVVILDNVTAPLLWKEPISRAAVLGVGVGVLAVILVVQ